MLIVFGGLPGTGKTTIAREVAFQSSAIYLRIDTIEQAVRAAGVLALDIGPAGYMAAYALAEENLKLEKAVVADCVNPLAVTRMAWRSLAVSASSPIIEIEVICSDPLEHRRRIENRISDVPALAASTWDSVLNHDYQPWSESRMVIDTAWVSPREGALRVASEMNAHQSRTGPSTSLG